MPGKPAWFKELFGFEEGGSFSATRDRFRLEGETLVCSSSPHPRQHVGPFDFASVDELRARVAAAEAGAEAGAALGGLGFSHLPAPTGVVPLILDAANAGAVFQAASQFNCLEMTGPGVTPRAGVAIYFNDPTQGPKCALACPAATVYRNYLCLGGRGQDKRQLDGLADVGALLGNADGALWSMRNGYALPATPKAMAALGARLRDEPALAARAHGALRVGVHWATQAKPPKTHRVAQVFASACPVAYAKSTKSEDWEPFARLVLRAAYDATLLAARAIAAEERRRVRVYLTALGGGAFGNRVHWITDAIAAALDEHRDAPLDVFHVHYGTRVDRDYSHALPLRRAPAPGAAAGVGGAATSPAAPGADQGSAEATPSAAAPTADCAADGDRGSSSVEA